jgi:N-acetylmuramoyl-L-alanine amidase
MDCDVLTSTTFQAQAGQGWERRLGYGRPDAAAAARAEAGAIIHRVARANGWSPAFVKALAWQESGWQQDVVSSAGAVGIMQVMPETGEFVSRHLVGRSLDLDDPEDNVVAGVAFLQYLWELTDGDPELTLAGYYQGLRSVREVGMHDHTERYIANVLALRERFR